MTPQGHNETLSSAMSDLPPEFIYVSALNQYCIMGYTALFIFAAFGNLSLFSGLLRPYRLSKSGTSFLIINLCLADLIVTFFLIPTEILWRWTIAWKGGEFLCKFCQFVRAFGMYLSSNVVICTSVDRYFAVVHPLQLGGALRRVKRMVAAAWIVSALFACPQIFVYHVASHPKHPEFQQCVTKAFLAAEPYNEVAYNVGSVSALYILPLLVIIFTYGRILWKIHQKSREQQQQQQQQQASPQPQQGENFSNMNALQLPNSPSALKGRNHPVVIKFRQIGSQSQRQRVRQGEIPSGSASSSRGILRSTGPHTTTLTRARGHTLRMTLIILLAFIICWTPYVVMTLWYMLDREGASQVDGCLQEALFFMAIANSLVNPIIYGLMSRKPDVQRNCFQTAGLNTICCCSNSAVVRESEEEFSDSRNGARFPHIASIRGKSEPEVGQIYTLPRRGDAISAGRLSPTSSIVTMKTRPVPVHSVRCQLGVIWRNILGKGPEQETTFELSCASSSSWKGGGDDADPVEMVGTPL